MSRFDRSLPLEVRHRIGDPIARGVAAVAAVGVVECRAFDMEAREVDEGVFEIDGYAATWDTWYDVAGGPAAGGWRESVGRSAVTKTLRERDDVRFLINHEGLPLARTKSGTLELLADDLGFRTRVPAADLRNPRAQELRSALERRDVDQMSWAFWVTRQEWNADWTERRILEVIAADVSAVTFPANPATIIAARNDDTPADTAPVVRGMSLAIARAIVETL